MKVSINKYPHEVSVCFLATRLGPSCRTAPHCHCSSSYGLPVLGQFKSIASLRHQRLQAVWPNWDILESSLQQFFYKIISPNIWHCWAILKYVTKDCLGFFLGNCWKIWVYFNSSTWSLCLRAVIKDRILPTTVLRHLRLTLIDESCFPTRCLVATLLQPMNVSVDETVNHEMQIRDDTRFTIGRDFIVSLWSSLTFVNFIL